MSVWWSIALSTVALITAWQVGNRQRVGFLVSVFLQLGWIAYSVIGKQWGFLASSIIFAGMNYRNWRKWKQLDEAEEAKREPTQCGCLPERV